MLVDDPVISSPEFRIGEVRHACDCVLDRARLNLLLGLCGQRHMPANGTFATSCTEGSALLSEQDMY